MKTEYVTDWKNLSPKELRNIEKVHCWAKAYALPEGSAAWLVDEIYAEAPEVISVLTGTCVARAGMSKQAWREAELRSEALFTARRVVFGALHACGNVVTVEGKIEQLVKDGSTRGWPFVAVLYFNAEGKIQRDHTYMLPPPHHNEFERAAEIVEEQQVGA